jgi:hypothetical protein
MPRRLDQDTISAVHAASDGEEEPMHESLKPLASAEGTAP